MPRRQRGNILFLILLAIVLFVALTYAVNSGMRGGGKNASAESLSATASTILQTATLMENTIGRLKLTGDCSDTQISLENTVVGGYANSNAPTDKHCNVFDPAGGGMSWPAVPNGVGSEPYVIPNNVWASRVGTGADYPPVAPNTSVDLVLFLPILSAELCDEINSKLSNPASLAIDQIIVNKFQGSYIAINFIPDDGGNMAGFKGRPTGCLQSKTASYPFTATPSHPYFFYHVLLAR